jgi:tetratricopeptide (TPR) repeat protein
MSHRLSRLVVLLGTALLPLAARGQGTPYERGVRAFDARRYAEARTELSAAAKSDPKNAGAAYYLGRAYLADTAYSDAAKWLERAVDLDPKNSAYHLWLGNAYGSLAQRANKFKQPFLAKKVKNEFERAVELDPNNLDAREGLISFYLQAPGFMGGSVDKAKATAQEIAKRNAYRGHFAMGNIYAHDKDSAAVEREYTRVIADFPDSASGYYGAIALQLARKQFDAAWSTLDRLTQRRPQDMGVQYQIGRIAAVSGQNLDRGEQALRKYLTYTPSQNEPQLSRAHFRLAQIYEKRGQKELAVSEYKTTIAMEPKFQAAQEALKKLQ